LVSKGNSPKLADPFPTHARANVVGIYQTNRTLRHKTNLAAEQQRPGYSC
jgi:hypothetical protein